MLKALVKVMGKSGKRKITSIFAHLLLGISLLVIIYILQKGGVDVQF
jgi:hypothetical protein